MTPASRADGLGRLLDRGGADRQTLSGKLESATRSTTRLARLVETLLDVTLLSAGRLALLPERGSLAALVREVVDGLQAEAEKAGCRVRFEASGPAEGSWDAPRIGQVVTSLFSNALKYGAGAPIDVTVSSDETNARVSVRDPRR
jgi:signal transduction histidine kinase